MIEDVKYDSFVHTRKYLSLFMKKFAHACVCDLCVCVGVVVVVVDADSNNS